MNATLINEMMGIQALVAQTLAPPEAVNNFFQQLFGSFGTSILNILGAVVILIIGWIIALLAASITKGVLKRTKFDNKLASWVTGRPAVGRDTPQVEKWVSQAVYWLVIIFTVVAALNALQLTAVSAPLTSFLNNIVGFLPKVLGAAVLLAIAWAIATVVKMITTRSLQAFGLDERLGEQLNGSDRDELGSSSTMSLSQTVGNALYWFVFLLFLPAILNTLELQGTLEPVTQLLSQITNFLPKILAAVLIGAAGWLVAQVVRRIVTNLLAATGVDHLGSRFGLTPARGTQSLSSIVGLVVYVLILIPAAIAALQALQIEAISLPAVSMLEQIMGAFPLIFTAGVILALGYFLGRFVGDLVTSILTSLGFNNIFSALGIENLSRRTLALPASRDSAPAPVRTPAEIAGIIVLVGIMLFSTVAAVNILNIPALTVLITGIVIILGRILAGLVVFAIGLFLANLAYSIITSSGNPQTIILGQIARVAILALVSAMALQQIGVGSDIVNLAFGLLLGAVAVAIALAFGLGGRDIAAQQVREWLDSFKAKR